MSSRPYVALKSAFRVRPLTRSPSGWTWPSDDAARIELLGLQIPTPIWKLEDATTLVNYSRMVYCGAIAKKMARTGGSVHRGLPNTCTPICRSTTHSVDIVMRAMRCHWAVSGCPLQASTNDSEGIDC